jgi:hypothetical protein
MLNLCETKRFRKTGMSHVANVTIFSLIINIPVSITGTINSNVLISIKKHRTVMIVEMNLSLFFIAELNCKIEDDICRR